MAEGHPPKAQKPGKKKISRILGILYNNNSQSNGNHQISYSLYKGTGIFQKS
jgi:hypothetical protein